MVSCGKGERGRGRWTVSRKGKGREEGEGGEGGRRGRKERKEREEREEGEEGRRGRRGRKERGRKRGMIEFMKKTGCETAHVHMYLIIC